MCNMEFCEINIYLDYCLTCNVSSLLSFTVIHVYTYVYTVLFYIEKLIFNWLHRLQYVDVIFIEEKLPKMWYMILYSERKLVF